MHWTEIAAIVIVAMALIPVALLLAYVVVIMSHGISAFMTTRIPEEECRRYHTDYCVFVLGETTWEATINRNGKTIKLAAGDREGTPDLEFIRRAPAILERLDYYERAARETVAALTNSHLLDSIQSSASPEESNDFTLAFSFDTPDGVWGESIFVDFKNDRITGSSSAD